MEIAPSEHTVGEKEHRLRLDRFLLEVRPELGRHAIDRLLRTGAVRVGDRPRDGRHFVKRGDVVEVRPGPAAAPAGDPPRVLVRTPHLLAAGKPPGWTTNPVGGAAESLLAWAGRETAGATHRPGVLHRLDRGASGLVLFSLTPEAHRRVRRAFAARALEKVYLALVAGAVREPGDTIDLALARDSSGRMRPATDGLAARTAYRVLHAGKRASLLEVRPVTGRMHQIRAHLAAVGHPVLGDARYGIAADLPGVPRLWLHAWRLTLPPETATAVGAPGVIECALWGDLARHLRVLGMDGSLPRG
jgi:RluA family pseudouridine synthase